jgi:Carboxypeptidase regulatory-like domain/TonB-dependent Receptor Plug Domain
MSPLIKRGNMRQKVALVAFLWSAGVLPGQNSTASLSGVVHDPSGAAVAGAIIRATNTATNVSRSTKSNDTGSYVLTEIPVGDYRLDVSATGFKIANITGITLQIDQKSTLDVKLEIGQSSEVVNVVESVPMLQTEAHSTGAVIDNQKIVELPLNSRTFYSLAYLVPGVVPPAQNSTLGYRGGFNVAGASEASNNFTLNGLDNNDEAINAPSFRPSVDAIGEFKVLTGLYSAEYGRSSGGQVVVVTKSGTNQFHGTAFEYIRNQVVDARNFFTPANQDPVFKRNQFGATLGGPVRKDKTFFFFSYEGLRLRQEQDGKTTVPLPGMVNGDFSSLLSLATPIRIVDPTSGNPYPGNVIPLASMNPVGVALAKYFPAANLGTPAGSLPTNNYNFSALQTETLNQYSVRGDHTISLHDSLALGYNRMGDPSFLPFNSTCGSRLLPGFGCNSGLTTQLSTLSETHVFTPTLVNVASLGFNRYEQTRLQQDHNIDFISNFNIPNVFLGYMQNNTGLPQTAVKGFATLGGANNLPQDLITNSFQYTDRIEWVRGKHSLKFGADLRRLQVNALSASSSRGVFTFNADKTAPTTGYSLADLLVGYPTSTTHNPYAPWIYERNWAINVFAQDDWKVTPTLTLNLGLRWELNTPFETRGNTQSSLNTVTGQLLVAGVDGNPPNLYHYDYNNFGPRVGFAWSPGAQKTVYRGGYGIYYNAATTYNGIGQIYFNPPFRLPQTFNSTVASPITLSNPFPLTGGAGSNTLSGIDPNFATAYIQQWGAGVQRTLAGNFVLDVSYFGSKGTRLPNYVNINQPSAGPGTTAQVNARRPYPQWGNIGWYESNANSTYHSLLARLEKRFSHGVTFLTSYTYGKSIDDSPGFASNSDSSKSAPQNSWNLAAEKGLSDFDIRNRFVLSAVYELPFGSKRQFLASGWVSNVVGGWQLNWIFSAQSGHPLTPYYTANISNTFGAADRPNVAGDPNSGPKTANAWFNVAAFTAPAAGTFGNAGRNIIRAPGLEDLDITLARDFRVKERVSMKFRVEFFNALNHTNFAYPSGTVDGGAFGTISTASDPRQLQFALRIAF